MHSGEFSMSGAQHELRYDFGKNWADFIEKHLSNDVVEKSQDHLATFLRMRSLKGLTFLDIGCGSGLHSLAAHRIGADRVISFDYDRDSVATTEHVRNYTGVPPNWAVLHGSVLDREFMESLPKADIVYSWGVLHHTGDMWNAIRNAAIPLKPGGVYYIALYSSDIYVDPPPQYWLKLKRAYNRATPLKKRLMEWNYVLRFHIGPSLVAGENFITTIRKYGSVRRGMSFWTDVRDWLGGYPMDFASFYETQTFCKSELGLDLVNVKTGEGCTEYLFCRLDRNAYWHSIDQNRSLIPLRRPFLQHKDLCYKSPVPHLEAEADNEEHRRKSQLMMYEDGKILGLAHSLHHHIARYGGGRFSHWHNDIYFSASDRSDPNTNGRTYGYCEQF
jgi:SAM-dependent methyltransferase